MKQEGLLLISKDYRKWAQSPIEHFQLEVQPLFFAGGQLSSSLTGEEMEIECRFGITWCFAVSFSLPVLLDKLLLCSQWRSEFSGVQILHNKQMGFHQSKWRKAYCLKSCWCPAKEVTSSEKGCFIAARDRKRIYDINIHSLHCFVLLFY